MLSLIAALLLSAPPTARAQDDPAPTATDAADTNGDGTVSGKERRRKRRADRRRRNAAGKAMTAQEQDAADAADSKARGSAASGKASAAASALKSSLPSADAGGGMPGAQDGGGTGGGGSASGPPANAPGGGAATTPTAVVENRGSGDPGRPTSPSDFALASRSGYAPAFAAAGLKIGPDGRSVTRLDGKPATPEDYTRLQREIASMPAALGRRPDFFSIVSPEHYADLKRGYKEKKDGDPVYKDVGTTAGDRDFVHTASCDKLSGDCNKSSEKASYKKGEFVAPEDLDSMWSALQKELDGSAESGGAGELPSLAAARSQIARDKAMDAARVLLPRGPGQELSPSSDVPASSAPGASAVSQAVASVRKLWKSSGLAMPGGGRASGDGSKPSLWIGALALAALAGSALFLRRKG